jgi:hypothetical protein
MKEVGEVYNKLALFLEAVVLTATQESTNADAGESKGE